MTNNPVVRKSFPELVADASSHGWADILLNLAPSLDEAINAGPKSHVCCPVHGTQGSGDGFRVYSDFNQTGGTVCNTCGSKPNGFITLAWVKGYSTKDAVREVAAYLRGERDSSAPVRQAPLFKAPVIDYAKNEERIKYVWRGCKSLIGSPAATYLEKRGIWQVNMPVTLRFHPGLRYYFGPDKKLLGTFPVMVAPVTDKDGKIVCLHRTFVTSDGDKAPVPDAKKLMAKAAELAGSAIKLWSAGKVLGVAEGIETALAAHAIARIPVWSCVSAPLLETVDIPDSVELVVIWADKDISGRGIQAAEKLAARLRAAGKTVEIAVPDMDIPEGEKGVDWLDVLLKQGVEGFPPRWRNWKG